MPIYAYRCATCGHAQDVLQKMSDPLLSVCPACGAATYTKQVTAAGFQLKGSGWYVTDFRGGNTAGPKKDEASAAEPGAATETTAGDAKPGDKPADKAAEKATDKATDKAAEKPAAAEKAAAPAPAAPAAAPASGS